MPEFLIHTGVVSTDSALNFSIALIMVSFWKAMQNEKYSFWNYLFFIGLGLGFLSKGPIILVLTVPPIFLWIIIQKISIKAIYSKLPWFTGLLITAVISIPWYILAEQRSPGFLDYFIVGEHAIFSSGMERRFIRQRTLQASWDDLDIFARLCISLDPNCLV